jgi:glutamate/tyrosine decarboxylase-like PLP-dependent enzyme
MARATVRHATLSRDGALIGSPGTEPIPKYKIPSKGVGAPTAYQVIHDELTLDGNPQLSACPSPCVSTRSG